MSLSYAECSARERLALLLDAGSFHEWLPPAERLTSPHLAQLGVPSCLRRRRRDRPRDARPAGTVFVAAQEGAFMGGGVGEVHGAKLVGLLQPRAARPARRPCCCWPSPAACGCTRPTPA